MRTCKVCYRPQRVNRWGNIFKHTRGMDTCAGSGTKATLIRAGSR